MGILTTKLSALQLQMLWIFFYGISLIDLVIILLVKGIHKLF